MNRIWQLPNARAFPWWGLLLAAFVVGCGSRAFIPVTGTIYGTVLQVDGSPAPDALVVVEGAGLNARTDVRGRFVINGVPSVRPGQIGIYYNLRGDWISGNLRYGFTVFHFKVKEQQSYSIGAVTLQPDGSIRGSVALEGQSDGSGVLVQVDGMELQAITRASGDFVISGVPPYAHYSLTCSHPGYVPGRVEGVAVRAGEETPLPRTDLVRPSP